MPPPLIGLADRRRNGRRLQPIERGLQPIIAGFAGAAFGERQYFVRGGSNQPRGRKTRIAGFDELVSAGADPRADPPIDLPGA